MVLLFFFKSYFVVLKIFEYIYKEVWLIYKYICIPTLNFIKKNCHDNIETAVRRKLRVSEHIVKLY